MTITFLISILALVLATLSDAAPNPPTQQHKPQIASTSSGRIRPFLDNAYPNVYQYLGVPFAEPPVGQLRFAPPQPVHRSKKVISATQIPAGCYQLPPGRNIFDVYEPGFGFEGVNSEDCLKLDLYSPTTKSEQLLPILIFVYGGGFVQGGANETYEMPTGWVQAKQNLIVVNIQYRLNIFGFPNSAALHENNVGLQDVRAAVQWIHENAKAFGGDPERMTLWGQSAGSIAVNAWTYSYLKDPIVKGTISTSGVALSPRVGWQSMDVSQSNFTFVAEELGCSGSNDSQLKCMRKKPATTIIDYLRKYNGTEPLNFQPIADGKLVFSNYTERLRQGKVTKQPAILGSNRREGERTLDTNLNPNGPNQTLALADTVVGFLCPAQLTAKLRHKISGLETYRYEYKGNFSNISPLPWMGAYHGSPLPLLFGTTNVEAAHPKSGPSTPFELAVGSHMQDLWRAFVYDPYRLKNYGWPLNEGGAVNQTTDAVQLFPGADHKLSSVEHGAKRERYCTEVDPYLISETTPPGLTM